MRKISLLFVVVLLCTLFSGCAGFSGGSADVTDTYTAEFNDIPIPKDMGIEKDATEIVTDGNVRSGYMRFSGNVEWLSLINACLYNMHNQGWSPLAVYKHKNGMLVFSKGDRVCVMSFADSLTSTTMRVWVCPRMNGFTMPPTMPKSPAPAEAVETYEERQSQPETTDSYQPSNSASQTQGGSGLSEAGLSE